jgi:CheY-like chemotaxis protein
VTPRRLGPGEALRLAREHAGAIHLLMTDVVMPEMNGPDAVKEIRALGYQGTVLGTATATAFPALGRPLSSHSSLPSISAPPTCPLFARARRADGQRFAGG